MTHSSAVLKSAVVSAYLPEPVLLSPGGTCCAPPYQPGPTSLALPLPLAPPKSPPGLTAISVGVKSPPPAAPPPTAPPPPGPSSMLLLVRMAPPYAPCAVLDGPSGAGTGLAPESAREYCCCCWAADGATVWADDGAERGLSGRSASTSGGMPIAHRASVASQHVGAFATTARKPWTARS